VGLLFEICIVDASIFATRCIHPHLWWGWLSGCESVIDGMAGIRISCVVVAAHLFDWGVGGVFFRRARMPRVLGCCVCCFDVVETSYEGHMVDALASRADEGRWSLR
jgi:hypothetical protein